MQLKRLKLRSDMGMTQSCRIVQATLAIGTLLIWLLLTIAL
jgi:hypothetical protein